MHENTTQIEGRNTGRQSERSRSPLRIMLLTRSLVTGGAERQLVTIAKGLHRKGHRVAVGVFYENGRFEKDLMDFGVPVYALGKNGRWDFWRFMERLKALVEKEAPEIISACHTTPNIFAMLLKPFFPRIPIVLGIRASNMDMTQYDPMARLTDSMVRRLGCIANLVIANSRAGAEYAMRHGLPKRRLMVIQNGIDTEAFYPDAQAGKTLRAKWGLGPGERLIGIVGRFDPQKGYPIFFRAATLLSAVNRGFRFIVAGDGPSGFSSELRRLTMELGIQDRVIWAGLRIDMRSVYSALDVLCSSSVYGEGFSNAVGEAMACGVPCAVTDVGDSAEIVDGLGEVSPPGDTVSLKEALMRLLDRTRFEPALSGDCRSRIERLYSVEKMVNATEAAFMKTCGF